MHLNRNGKGVETLLYKIKNAPIEAFKTKINKMIMKILTTITVLLKI